MTREQLAALASFHPGLQAGSRFQSGMWASSHTPRSEWIVVDAFWVVLRENGWIKEGFDWEDWGFHPTARMLFDDCVPEAAPIDLAHMLTWILYSDERIENNIVGAFYDGLMEKIAYRAKELLDAQA